MSPFAPHRRTYARRRRPALFRQLRQVAALAVVGALWLAHATGLPSLAELEQRLTAPFAAHQQTQEPDRSVVTASLGRHFAMCGSMPRSDCVVDGDTFYYGRDKVRIADIDTPEIFSPRCASERRLGEQASRRLQMLLNQGPIELASVDRDRDAYGRLLRVVSRDGSSLGDRLVAEGLAHRWVGHKLSWCS